MAEFLNQVVPTRLSKEGSNSGFDAMGKPVPWHRQSAALEHCRQMGIHNIEDAMNCVSGMAQQLERDKSYEAMAAGMKYLDLTGTYRLMAVLLCAEEQPTKKEPKHANRKGTRR